MGHKWRLKALWEVSRLFSNASAPDQVCSTWLPTQDSQRATSRRRGVGSRWLCIFSSCPGSGGQICLFWTRRDAQGVEWEWLFHSIQLLQTFGWGFSLSSIELARLWYSPGRCPPSSPFGDQQSTLNLHEASGYGGKQTHGRGNVPSGRVSSSPLCCSTWVYWGKVNVLDSLTSCSRLYVQPMESTLRQQPMLHSMKNSTKPISVNRWRPLIEKEQFAQDMKKQERYGHIRERHQWVNGLGNEPLLPADLRCLIKVAMVAQNICK